LYEANRPPVVVAPVSPETVICGTIAKPTVTGFRCK
jgi:hypothetical protein